jgi:hypothetical protein
MEEKKSRKRKRRKEEKNQKRASGDRFGPGPNQACGPSTFS